jgi:hypothetical protein
MSLCASKFLVADSTSRKTPHFFGTKHWNRFFEIQSKRLALSVYLKISSIVYQLPSQDEPIGTPLDPPLFWLDNIFNALHWKLIIMFGSFGLDSDTDSKPGFEFLSEIYRWPDPEPNLKKKVLDQQHWGTVTLYSRHLRPCNGHTVLLQFLFLFPFLSPLDSNRCLDSIWLCAFGSCTLYRARTLELPIGRKQGVWVDS